MSGPMWECVGLHERGLAVGDQIETSSLGARFDVEAMG